MSEVANSRCSNDVDGSVELEAGGVPALSARFLAILEVPSTCCLR
jgi:hypothetical protein